jgi:hypothetical protein
VGHPLGTTLCRLYCPAGSYDGLGNPSFPLWDVGLTTHIVCESAKQFDESGQTSTYPIVHMKMDEITLFVIC